MTILRGHFWTLALLLVLSINAYSQILEPTFLPIPSPTPSPTPSSIEKQFFKNILDDQVQIWMSPFRSSRRNAKILVPIAITAGALIATDRWTASELGEDGGNKDRERASLGISRVGALYVSGGAAAAFYLVGVSKNDTRARETGVLSAEALINAQIVTTVLKVATQRPRPLEGGSNGNFFDGGYSFPSGHATNAWAVATVVANEYKHRKAVQVTAYGLAAAISLSRYTGRSHFLSDVLVGSLIGYGVGRYVFKTRHVEDTSQQSNQKRTKWMPFVAPVYNVNERTYGVVLTLQN